ncbi:hypothetical protein M2O51_10515 [Enterobacter hormaechei]|uniref:hypothetical protein n=1 Tax=Enterobacter hormaechei TaxID=158836 RepID=UPI000696A2F0|nr:hypothetical protein [Enterobacter hormaechei]MBE8779213.1 hypothetical protein [Enterobacter hormaechei]OUE98844.1 hypothetical protein AZZ90_003965 [Enterobacter hormaechei]RAL76075.1 hypothetical protein CSC35_4634 [Enterobacter hormaechei]WLQ00071.1 hypothetical protein M2O51_10515 [Enterobacter hormaechei]HAS1882515.1 hypothetical protein [Enterobacter hormaechei subsp. xiangfangensis]
MNHKTCSKCGVEKPTSEFYKKPSNKDGFEGACKSCRNTQIQKQRLTDAGRASAKRAQEKYAKTEKGKANQFRKDHSEKGQARRARFLTGETRRKWNEEYYSRADVKERQREAQRRHYHSGKGMSYMREYNSRSDVRSKKAIYDLERRGNPELREARLARARQLSRLERNKAVKRAYQESEAGRGSRRRIDKKRYFSNLIKVKARRLLRTEVDKGLILRPTTCESCHSVGAVHAHHDDYSKPLSVRWMCPQCHKDWHRLNGPGING